MMAHVFRALVLRAQTRVWPTHEYEPHVPRVHGGDVSRSYPSNLHPPQCTPGWREDLWKEGFMLDSFRCSPRKRDPPRIPPVLSTGERNPSKRDSFGGGEPQYIPLKHRPRLLGVTLAVSCWQGELGGDPTVPEGASGVSHGTSKKDTSNLICPAQVGSTDIPKPAQRNP